MEVFRAVIETGSVTAASRVLHVSQPAVTALLRHTEDQLGFRLFDRVKGRLAPTAEARTLYAEIVHVFDRVDVVNRVVEDMRDSRVGTLDLVAIPALALTLLPTVIGAFTARGRQVQIRFHMRTRQEMVDQVSSGAADLGFGFLSPASPRITIREIAQGDLACILPRGHVLCERAEISVGDLRGYPVIGYTSRQGLAPIINGLLAEARVAVCCPIEVGLIINAWSLVSQGAGIAIVDPHSGYQELFPNVVSRPLRPKISITLEALQAADRPLPRLAASFLAHIDRVLSGRADNATRRRG
ncbi:LysR family transcriptional regulator [Limobrevibacterium gyesilva]|uniref:LysR family transcriptional regulator n=1 Tax=Limobrevibacterium gyesilva TaxID=2991712 RepID=A0AA42CHI9_9PROT|nr:LysR family transcriptional regulator [Limobrevibacterium gyesilva]MCW3477301.1 LysR family transcriptional regulator [Limobrevibacterium gyesilva]